MPDEHDQRAWEAAMASLLQGDGVATLLKSPEYERAVVERLRLQEIEEQIAEEAPWFGATGLSESTERELPRYLRREFGQTIFDEDSLKASNLEYVGCFSENGAVIHYWRIADEKETAFAYVELRGEIEALGWGGSGPPGPACQP